MRIENKGCRTLNRRREMKNGQRNYANHVIIIKVEDFVRLKMIVRTQNPRRERSFLKPQNFNVVIYTSKCGAGQSLTFVADFPFLRGQGLNYVIY